MGVVPVRPVGDAGRLAGELGHGKPVVLHFWATWCGACVDEFPRLRAELLRLPGRGFTVELVSIDRPEDSAKVQHFLARFGLSGLPAVILDAPDPGPVAKAVGDHRWDGTLPSTFLFDARGKLIRSFIGRTSAAALSGAARKVSRKTGRAPAGIDKP